MTVSAPRKPEKEKMMLSLLAENASSALRRVATLAVSLVIVSGCAAFAQTPQTTRIKFANVADSTQGLSQFSQFPAINNHGAVAFIATQSDTKQGVFKWDDRGLRTITSTADERFSLFTDDVVINPAGVVGFRAILTTGRRAAGIFTSDGSDIKTIVNSTDQGLSGPSVGAPSINASGTVAFQAARSGLTSTIIFTGNGGPLTTVLDALNSNFKSFGAVAINSAGQIVFNGTQKDRTAGIFVVTSKREGTEKDGASGSTNLIDIVDTNNPDFFGFGDPVINDAGVVADSGGGGLHEEIFSADAKGITARTDPASPIFADFEHPSINNHGAVGFSTFETDGGQGIFVELTGGTSPVAVLQTGDTLFGSTVTAVSVGRFAFNDHFRLAFEYELEDGRSGIATAYVQVERNDQDEQSEN